VVTIKLMQRARIMETGECEGVVMGVGWVKNSRGRAEINITSGGRQHAGSKRDVRP